MLKIRTLLVAAALLHSLVNQALAYTYPGHPACPWADKTHSWLDFMSGKFGSPVFFSIQFTRDIGDLQGGQCYRIEYAGNENWSASRKIRDQNKSKVEPRHGGDPATSRINVWGAQFTFNEAGEVFYVLDGKQAGNLFCHVGSECWK